MSYHYKCKKNGNFWKNTKTGDFNDLILECIKYQHFLM